MSPGGHPNLLGPSEAPSAARLAPCSPDKTDIPSAALNAIAAKASLAQLPCRTAVLFVVLAKRHGLEKGGTRHRVDRGKNRRGRAAPSTPPVTADRRGSERVGAVARFYGPAPSGATVATGARMAMRRQRCRGPHRPAGLNRHRACVVTRLTSSKAPQARTRPRQHRGGNGRRRDEGVGLTPRSCPNTQAAPATPHPHHRMALPQPHVGRSGHRRRGLPFRTPMTNATLSSPASQRPDRRPSAFGAEGHDRPSCLAVAECHAPPGTTRTARWHGPATPRGRISSAAGRCVDRSSSPWPDRRPATCVGLRVPRSRCAAAR